MRLNLIERTENLLPYQCYCPHCQRVLTACNVMEVQNKGDDSYYYVHDAEVEHPENWAEELRAVRH